MAIDGDDDWITDEEWREHFGLHLLRPLDALATLTELRSTLDRVEELLVLHARRTRLSTWAELGSALGVTRQAALRRHRAAAARAGILRRRPPRRPQPWERLPP